MQDNSKLSKEELKKAHREHLMAEAINKFTEEQRANILGAVLTLKDGEPEAMLEDLTSLYFMALEHYLMDDADVRATKTCTFLFLRNFIAHIDCILNERDGFYALAI